ncbi:AP-1-like transcription factor [Verticillium dahliae VDG1]|nr:AP-1-like transcription factor [Verticillium dahliae VDG1]
MAPAFRIHKPDVLATLPRPLDSSTGQYHAGEVFTQQPGSKKRKRLEVAVGVDGEAANIYHIPSSDLRTSYPIPPQESFTCAPYSIRYQRPNANDRDQYTYFSTKDGSVSGSKMTVCKDVVSPSGKTTSTTRSQRLRHKAPVARIYTSHHANVTPDAEAGGHAYSDVLAVCNDGQIVCLDGAALDERWTMSAYSLCKDLLPPATSGLEGVFGGRQDALGAFGRTIDAETFNPDVLVLVATTRGKEETGRYLIVLGAVARNSTTNAAQQALVQLHVAPLPRHEGLATVKTPTYQLHVRTGRLIELCDNIMRTYDLTTAVPRLRDAVIMPDASSSFVQLSEHSVLSLSPMALTITNITYRSVQAQSAVTMESGAQGGGHPPMLLTYLSKLDLAIAIVNNTIYSIQIERHKASSKEGLLIDAIGRGLSKADHLPADLPQRRGKAAFSKYLPGTLTDAYVKQSLVEVEEMDDALGQNDLKEFERLLAAKFGVAIDDNALLYLVVAGHLTLSNILAAFRSELKEADVSLFALADVLVQQLVGVDPALELLMSYLSATKLGEVELLLIVRTIMQSLDQQPRLALPMPNGTQEEEFVTMEIDQLERELELAEYNLGDESNVRARLLTAAFERLAGYSSVSTVRALRIAFHPTEILALIHLLRIQLVGSAWTTRYTEMTTFDQDEAARTASDGVITLIAELLARCIDAVGTHGWLTSVSVGHQQAEGGHFLTALKLEVSAALEGLNEAVEMNGILGEAVRFGTASLAGRSARAGGDRARAVEVVASAELPLGLTPKQGVTQFKVVSGGEVVERSAREKGHLLSQRVKEYSLERIAI